MSSAQKKEIGKRIAGNLLDIGAIKLSLNEPYRWSSGWRSPIYCDNRLALSYPVIRDEIKGLLVDMIRESYPGVESIAGVATAGIPQGALIADALDLPFLYVRAKPKGHGMENLIEGKITREQKVVVLEDLVSTGGSSLKAVQALRENEFEVLGMAAIFTYGFKLAEINFREAEVPLVYLSDYHFLLDEALDRGFITADEMVELKAWRVDPEHWHHVEGS